MKKLMVFFGVLLVFCLVACGGPSDEDIAIAIEKTNEAEAPDIPEPIAVPVVEEKVCPINEEQHPDWNTQFCETFDNNDYQWDMGLDPKMGTEYSMESGKYIISYNSANETGYTTGLSIAQPFWEAGDSVVSILGEMKSKNKQCTWGVLVNGFFDTGVSFDIDNQGHYFVTDYGYAGDPYLGNAKSGANNAIKWDAPNTITVVTEDESLTFFVNGTLITGYEFNDVDDDTISLLLWAAEGVSVDYEIDQILVREK